MKSISKVSCTTHWKRNEMWCTCNAVNQQHLHYWKHLKFVLNVCTMTMSILMLWWHNLIIKCIKQNKLDSFCCTWSAFDIFYCIQLFLLITILIFVTGRYRCGFKSYWYLWWPGQQAASGSPYWWRLVYQLRQVLHDLQWLWLPGHHIWCSNPSAACNQGLYWLYSVLISLSCHR